MKKLFLGILVCLSVSAKAQLRLPQPSSAASVSQTVGTTDFTVKYSRPNVRGREIFGSLIAYDKVWRTGANAATQITFSNDITHILHELFICLKKYNFVFTSNRDKKVICHIAKHVFLRMM